MPLWTLAGWTRPSFQVSRMQEIICKPGCGRSDTWAGLPRKSQPSSPPLWAGLRRVSILPPMSENPDMGHPFFCWSDLAPPEVPRAHHQVDVLEDVAVGSIAARGHLVGVSQVSKARPGAPILMAGQTWATRLASYRYPRSPKARDRGHPRLVLKR